MNRFLCLLAASALAACSAGTTPRDSGPPPATCTSRAECDAVPGEVCVLAGDAGRCGACSSSGQCTLREECSADAGLCVLKSGWGTVCLRNEECQAGSYCRQGLCRPRREVVLCPGGTSAECNQGERCNALTQVCEEDLGCATDADCSSREVCNVALRVCVPRCTAETQATVCAGGERCVNERCVQCATAQDCGPGLTCNAAGRCSAENLCFSDRDCQVPLRCFTRTGACLPPRPPCITNDTCGPTERCDVGTGRCVPRMCPADVTEPSNAEAQAYPLMMGQLQNLTLCQGDSDWFAVQLARGDQLGIVVDTDPFSENAYSTVIKDPTGRTVAAGKLLVSYVAPAAGRYFVVVSSTDAFQQYDVTALVSRGIPCDDDRFEPNDSRETPTPLNQTTSLDGVVCPQDQDWFRLSPPPGRGVRARLTGLRAGAGLLNLCLYAADGGTLTCSEELQSQVSVPREALGDGGLLRVAGSNERVSNVYTLTVEYP